jgi:hypothetical protein
MVRSAREGDVRHTRADAPLSGRSSFGTVKLLAGTSPRPVDRHAPSSRPFADPGDPPMSNVAGKAYAMNVITPMRPPRTWINALLFTIARASPSILAGLLGLSLIHFARWVIIRRDQWPNFGQGREAPLNDYMLFCSNFNGTWDQYIEAFCDGIPNGLDLFWYSSTKYP